jgi:tRNA G10  N-methylase Trm11
MRRPIVNNSRPGELVYDPFLGSGTSLIAAEMTGRICCGLEISPAYVDVILRRWQAFTGRNAIHQKSGRLFDERCEDPDRCRTRLQRAHAANADLKYRASKFDDCASVPQSVR